MSLAAIIRQYKHLRKKHPDQHLSDATKHSNLSDAINYAAKARDLSGRKHPHQYRIPNPTLDNFAKKLQTRKAIIEAVRDFDQLIAEVEKAKIHGIGGLAVYDTALRIGTYLDIHPTQVYLHQGTKVGAEKLLGKKTSGVTSLPISCFPKALQTLSAAGIEDILCIYKDSFVQTSAVGSASACIPASGSKSKC